jgi:MFS family permease
MSSTRLFTREFALVSLANFANGISFALFFPLSGYLADLGASKDTIGLIFGVAALAAIAMRPYLGRAMDTYGRRPVILAGGVVNLIFVLLYLTVSAIGPWVYVVRLGHGVAEAALFSALFTYGADVVPEERRTEGIALFGVSALLPIAIAGVLGDVVLNLGGFEELFMTAAFFALLTLLFSLPLPERMPEIDVDHQPLGFISVMRNPTLLPLWWMIGWFSFVLTGYFVFIRNYVDDTGIGSVGMFFGVYATTAILVRLFFGKLPDRIGRKRVLFPMILALVAGFVILATATSWVGVAVAGVLCGAGHGFAFPIFTAMVVDRAPTPDRGSAIAMFTSLFDVGLLIGGPVLGAIIEAADYAAMWLFSAVVLFLAMVVFWRWDAGIEASRAVTVSESAIPE